MRAYIDSDILIWHLRGEDKATRFLKKISSDNEYTLWIGAMQRAEIIFFMRPDEESATELFLSHFHTASLDQKIIDAGGKLYRKWHPSHAVDINDALLAATAMETGGCVFTLNTKHYPMQNIQVHKGW